MHRDITSGNVLLREGGHACLADFGLAHQLPTAESTVIGSVLQADSILMGTFGYMAPEYSAKTGRYLLAAAAHLSHLRVINCHGKCNLAESATEQASDHAVRQFQ